MTTFSIVIFAFIYVGALTCLFVKKCLPQSFTLLGVEYGHKFKDLSTKGKVVHVLITIGEYLFSIVHFVLPPVTALFWNWPRMERWFLFLVVYVVSVVLWLIIFAIDGPGKRQYFEQRSKIIHESPLYIRMLEKLRENPAIVVVAPLKDGIAFYNSKLPDDFQSYDVTGECGYNEFSSFVESCASNWEREQQERFSSLYKCGCDDGLLISNFGLTELTDEDKEELCLFLSKEEGYGLKKKTYSISCEYYVDYEITTTTTYGDGHTSSSTKDKRQSSIGSFNMKIAVRKVKKK